MAARRAAPAKPTTDSPEPDAGSSAAATTAKPAAPARTPKAPKAPEDAPLVPGGSPAAVREAAPSDFIKAKIPAQYGSATIYGRGGKETVHAGGEVVEMTRAQADRIGAVEVKAKAAAQAETGEEE